MGGGEPRPGKGWGAPPAGQGAFAPAWAALPAWGCRSGGALSVRLPRRARIRRPPGFGQALRPATVCPPGTGGSPGPRRGLFAFHCAVPPARGWVLSWVERERFAPRPRQCPTPLGELLSFPGQRAVPSRGGHAGSCVPNAAATSVAFPLQQAPGQGLPTPLAVQSWTWAAGQLLPGLVAAERKPRAVRSTLGWRRTPPCCRPWQGHLCQGSRG